MKIKIFFMVVLICTVLSGCKGEEIPEEIPFEPEISESEVSKPESEPEPEPELEIDDAVDSTEENPIDFFEFLENINTGRVEEMNTVPEEITDVSLSHEYDNLLSHEECQMLIETKETKGNLSKEEAIEDAEYLWKAFASSYGGYYYFGDETFKNAHQNVVKRISEIENGSITLGKFEHILKQEYSFIRDSHVRFYEGTFYKLYYVNGLFIREDANGFYCMIDGKKWHLVSVDKGSIEDYMQVTIAENGELVYGFYHRFLTGSDENMPEALTVKRGSRTKEFPLKWVLSEALGGDQANTPERFYATQNIDGHNIVKIRKFDYFGDNESAKILEEYMETGNTLSGEDYVIIDSRSNGGGSGNCACVWMHRFLGDPSKNMDKPFWQAFQGSNVLFSVFSRLNEYAVKQIFPEEKISLGITEYPRLCEITYGKQTKNKHPLFVLTDYLSGSAGEGIITSYRTVENVLIIGTNTNGCMFGNVQIGICLPNSGYWVGFGQSVSLEDFVNREGWGYDPDIWVPSEYALELTLKMCEYYNLSDPDATVLPEYGEIVERVNLEDYAEELSFAVS